MALKGGERLNGGEKACTKSSSKGGSTQKGSTKDGKKDGEGLLASVNGA